MTVDSTMTFEKHLRLVSRAASQRLNILYSMIDRLLGDSFGVLSCPFWSTVLPCGARLPIHTLNYWTVKSLVPVFWLGLCLSVWHCSSSICGSTVYAVYKLGVTRSTLFLVLWLYRMRQCWLHAMLWSDIGVCLCGALQSLAILQDIILFPSQCPCVTILLTLYLMVWDCWVSKAGSMLIYWPNLLYLFLSSTVFSYLFFLSIGWYCGAGVFWLIGCYHYLSALYSQPLLIIIILWIATSGSCH